MVRTGKPIRMVRDGGAALAMEHADAVAAHQAICSCHEIVGDPDTERTGEKCATCGRPAKPDARDSRGHEWHIDQLCKVRPEARA